MSADNIMEKNNKQQYSVTCILPTRGRPDFLRRAVLLLEHTNPEVKLIVVDSSRDDEFEEDMQILRQSCLKEVVVRRYSYETGFYQKLSDTIDRVETDYFYFMADDDLIMKEGVEACCEVLEAEKDIICAAGEIFVHNYNRPNSYSTYLNYSFSKYPSQSDIGEDAALRVSHHLSNYKATFYSVYRTRDCQAPFNTIAKVGGDLRLAEVFSSCLVIASGKRRVIKMPFGIRTAHAEAHHSHALSMKEKLQDPVFRSELQRIFEMTCQISMRNSSQDVRLHLAQATSVYLKNVGVPKNEVIGLQNMLLSNNINADDITFNRPEFEFLGESIIDSTSKTNLPVSRSYSNIHELLAICEVSVLGIKKGEVQETFKHADKILSHGFISELII